MKIILQWIITLILISTFTAKADYISPGNGSHFTMDSLVTNSAGAVSGNDSVYYIHQSIQISATDTLTIERGKTVVFTDITGLAELNINGALIANGSVEDSIIFTSQNQAPGDYYGLNFRNTTTGSDFQLRFCRIEFATKAIDIVDADASVEYCLIQYNSHTAVDLSSSNSTITNCVIRRNAQRTIFMTLSSSPSIEGNNIYENNYENSSPYPFINIGLQGVNSPIITNNHILGGNEMSGAIAIWNASNAEIDNNIIENCGYGILCYQSNANPLIKNNTILNNTIHPDTLNWGFAIACNGSNTPVISGNIIQGNYYGIAIINGAQPNVGNLSNTDTTDDGNNQFLGNGIGDDLYELYNNNSLPISAENNWWNTNDPDSIEARIVHQVDNAAYGLVDFDPFIQNNPSRLENAENLIPQQVEIYDAYPNPFNPVTQISFKLGRADEVKINIFNLLGEHVATIADIRLNKDFHSFTWNGTNEKGQHVSSGIYFFTIETGSQIFSNKIILLR